MRSILLQLYLFGLFSTSVGQQQGPACLPEQWEAEAVGDVAEIASTSGGVEIFYLRYRQSYDFTNKRESTQQLVEIGNVTRRITTVTDWTKMETTEILLDLKRCKKYSIPPPGMKRWCKGDRDLILVDSFMVGDEMADIYRLRIHNKSSTITLFQKSFQIITTVTEQSLAGVPQSISLQYGNFTEGIRDTSVFDIPDYCKPKSQTRCTPDQWQAVAFIKYGEGSSAGGSRAKVAVDYKHKIEAYDGYSAPDEGGSQTRYKLVKFFAQNTSYHVYPDMKLCKKANITVGSIPAIPQICAHPDQRGYRTEAMNVGGKIADVYYLGEGDAKNRTMVTAYRDTLEYISLLQPHMTSTTGTVIAIQFGNFTAGIKNPKDVFSIPDYCHK